MDAQQLRKLIIDVLMDINMYSHDAVELLMLTAAQETHCGRWIEQMDDGPALGIFQMEPSSIDDLFDSVLKYSPNKMSKVHRYFSNGPLISNIELRGNIPLQIVLARMYYSRFSEPLPAYTDIEEVAKYYKIYWNTKKGKATVNEAINAYTKWAI